MEVDPEVVRCIAPAAQDASRLSNLVDVIDALADHGVEIAHNVVTKGVGTVAPVVMGAVLAYGVPKFGQWIWE
ncbi:hypothetical protein [Rhodococcus sp. 1168]|uniref:hypothetical protein n=1 Tax=Rhodococcus sp. 1168 TaxID=2018041 RepID=UPI00111C4261|nr:hypothetical protein [Rhodococcus sp. 1168]